MTLLHKGDLVKMKRFSMGERGEVIRVARSREWIDVRWRLSDGESFSEWSKRMRPDQLEKYGIAGHN